MGTPVNTGLQLRDAAKALFAATETVGQANVDDLLVRRIVRCEFNDAATAATACTAKLLWRNYTGVAMRVVAVYVTAPVAVTANDTNYATALVSSVTAAGATKTTVATLNTTVTVAPFTGSLVALAATTAAGAISGAAAAVAAGSSLICEITKTGAGVAIVGSATINAPTFIIEVELEPM